MYCLDRNGISLVEKAALYKDSLDRKVEEKYFYIWKRKASLTDSDYEGTKTKRNKEEEEYVNDCGVFDDEDEEDNSCDEYEEIQRYRELVFNKRPVIQNSICDFIRDRNYNKNTENKSIICSSLSKSRCVVEKQRKRVTFNDVPMVRYISYQVLVKYTG